MRLHVLVPIVVCLAVLVSLAALFAPVARAGARRHRSGTTVPAAAKSDSKPAAKADVVARIAVSCDPLPGDAPDQPPLLRSGVGLNYTNDMLEHPADGAVAVCLLVDSTGAVREAGILESSGLAAPFDAAAIDAARWWVFAPARRGGRAVPARIQLSVAARVPRDADPMVPDVVALALDAEAHGDLRGALDAWTGAIARTGTQPALQNEWVLREHVVRLAARLPKPPEVPMLTESRARAMHNLMLRNIARADNADYAKALDDVLLTAPWYAAAYRWRASARAASGQRDGAVRDVLCYRLAARDSADRAVAERALVALAAADTIAALTMLKN